MRIDLFSIGPITLHSYGLMIAIGVIAALVVGEKRAVKMDLSPDHIFSMGLWGVVAGIIGARLTFLLTELPAVIANPSMIWDISSGFVVYGGVILGVLTAGVYCRIKKLAFGHYVDLAAPSIALAQGFGRIGCFLAGCCYGRETHSHFAVVFPEGSFAPAGIPLIPTQLLSSIGDFALCVVLLLFARKARYSGQVIALYMILYSAGRFVIEFFRNDPRGTVGMLSTSQFIALFVGFGGVLVMILSVKKARKSAVLLAREAKGEVDTEV